MQLGFGYPGKNRKNPAVGEKTIRYTVIIKIAPLLGNFPQKDRNVLI